MSKVISFSVMNAEEKERLDRIAAEHGLANAATMSRMMLYEGLNRRKWDLPIANQRKSPRSTAFASGGNVGESSAE